MLPYISRYTQTSLFYNSREGFSSFDGCNIISFFFAVTKKVSIGNNCLPYLPRRQTSSSSPSDILKLRPTWLASTAGTSTTSPSSQLKESSSAATSFFLNGKSLYQLSSFLLLCTCEILGIGCRCRRRGPLCKTDPSSQTCPVIDKEGDRLLQIGHQLLREKVGF
jgi:hypothetical protein